MCNRLTKIAVLFAVVALPAPGIAAAQAENRITILYDAFGKPSELKKDWGFSALVEVNGKRILFDTGNNVDNFAHNVKTKGVDLTALDFVVISHRHGDHIGGLNHLLRINPDVKMYAPEEGFGVFGFALPGTFYPQNESLPLEQRYFGGNPPATLHFGSAWPQGNFNLVVEATEVAPGFHLLALPGAWGSDPPVVELSLAIDTPEGIVLVVGCSHPTIEKIVEAAKAAIDKPIHVVIGGTHLLPAPEEEIQRIAVALRDTWKVQWIAPAHCTGEPAFEILQETFGDRYIYAGLGTTVGLGAHPFDENLPDQPADLTGELVPPDDGFGRPIGNGEFNTPSLVEAADTGPFFHNNAIETIEGAVAFYNGNAFNDSPAGKLLLAATGSGIDLEATQVVEVAAFLRVINALENIRESVSLLEIALEAQRFGHSRAERALERAAHEAEDGRTVLAGGGLRPAAVGFLDEVYRLTRQALERDDSARQRLVREAIDELESARNELVEEDA